MNGTQQLAGLYGNQASAALLVYAAAIDMKLVCRYVYIAIYVAL